MTKREATVYSLSRALRMAREQRDDPLTRLLEVAFEAAVARLMDEWREEVDAE